MRRAWLFAVWFLSVVAIVFFGWDIYQYQRSPFERTEEYVLMPGTSLAAWAHDLSARNLTKRPLYLYTYFALRGGAGKLKAGEYYLNPELSLAEVFEWVVTGKVIQRPMTFVEGMTFQEMLARLWIEPKITATLKNESQEIIRAKIGVTESELEGVFFPDTYFFYTGMQDIEILKMAYQKMQKILQTFWSKKHADLPYKSPYDALILASIIEKETAVAAEKPKIAGVFLKRILLGMPLQADPTVIYGLGETFQGDLKKEDLKNPNPHNTYVHPGLPPTAICAPGIASIRAALQPDISGALYFVAKGDGTHHFSDNLKEHNKAIKQYQRKTNASP